MHSQKGETPQQQTHYSSQCCTYLFSGGCDPGGEVAEKQCTNTEQLRARGELGEMFSLEKGSIFTFTILTQKTNRIRFFIQQVHFTFSSPTNKAIVDDVGDGGKNENNFKSLGIKDLARNL